jgi:putative oxidoreductase
MTTGVIDKKRLIFPGLAGLYETFSPASYSFMRFATGAVLVPHGIQKIMLGSAVNLAPYIDKQMGVPYPLIGPISQSSPNR